MREATLVLQSQSRVIQDAMTAIDDDGGDGARVRALTEQVLRVFVASLTGAPIHERTERQLRERYVDDDRRRVVHAVHHAINKLGAKGSAVDAAFVYAKRVLDVDASSDDLAPRPSLVTAMDAFSRLSPEESPFTPVAMLRIRAQSVTAAETLETARRLTTLSLDAAFLPSASDEVIVGASGPIPDAVSRLVRLASQWFRAVPTAHVEEIQAALVLIDGHGPSALRAATIHAAKKLKRDGLMTVDEGAFHAVGGLAEHPSAPLTVDPRAAFGHDRWELSSLLGKPPFVGRDALVEKLGFALADGGDGAQLNVVHGPSGIGKSSVLRRALKEAGYGDPRAPVLWGAADPLQPTPYAPIVAMVRALASAPAGSLGARSKLRRLLHGLSESLPPDDGKELLSLEKILAYLIGAADDDDDEILEREVEELSPRALRVAVRRAVLLVVGAMRERGHGRPAVLVIPGGDAIDGPTAELLTFLARRLNEGLRVVFLSSTRMRLPRTLAEGFTIERFEVPPLDPDAARQIFHAILDDNLADGDLGVLIEKAKGSPLCLVQLARFSVEGGLITRADQTFALTGLKANLLPGRVEKVISGRIARLPEIARRTLGFAAVLGPAFMPAAVEVIGVRAGIPREDIGRALNLLIETGFLQRSARRPAAPVFVDGHAENEDPLLTFDHPLIRAVAEDELGAKEGPDVHAHAADALMVLLPSGTRAIAAQLARHFRLAKLHRPAVDHLVLAVKRAVRLNNRAGAIAMAKEGLALIHDSDIENRVLFHMELERALEQGNDRDAHKDALKELVKLAEKSGDPRRQGQAYQRVARFNVFGGDHEKAEAAAMRSLERFRLVSDARGQAQALRVLALARFEQRNLDAAVDALTAARRLIDEIDARAVGIIEHQLGLMYLEGGDAVSALEHLLLALDSKKRTGDAAGEGACLDAIADVYLRTGRLDVASTLLERSVVLCERIGDEAGRAESTKGLAEVALSLGNALRASNLSQTAQRLAKSLDLERLERSCIVIGARAELMMDDAVAAEHLIDGVRRRLDEKRDPFAAMEAALISAHAKWARATRATSASARERLLKSALERARAAASLGETHGYATGQVLAPALIGRVLEAMGDPGGALLYAQRASELVDDRRATSLPVEEVFLTHARILRTLGDDDDAAFVVERAMTTLHARAHRLPAFMRGQFWDVPARSELRAMATETESGIRRHEITSPDRAVAD